MNELNQYESGTKAEYDYDLNGNLIEKKGDRKLKYDALNRLTSVITQDCTVIYKYDSGGRCLSKETTKNGQKDTVFFRYQFNTEVGTVDQFRILAGSEGPMIAVEQDKKIYTVISDHIGSVRSLIENENIVQTYRYSAFGERESLGS